MDYDHWSFRLGLRLNHVHELMHGEVVKRMGDFHSTQAGILMPNSEFLDANLERIRNLDDIFSQVSYYLLDIKIVLK